jgi:hypothetical protein
MTDPSTIPTPPEDERALTTEQRLEAATDPAEVRRIVREAGDPFRHAREGASPEMLRYLDSLG